MHGQDDSGHEAAGRDPRLLELLAGRQPASVIDVNWARPLRVSAYVGSAGLPDDLVTSVRCFVRVEEHVVVCTNVDGHTHAWPGGRREDAESCVDAAVREVFEETGWHVEPDTIEHIGFLHLHNRGEPLDPYPHPDTLQAVTTAVASSRAAEDWTDIEGYELTSRLVPLERATDALSPDEQMCVPFLRLLQHRDGTT